jgi:hypothetical protein
MTRKDFQMIADVLSKHMAHCDTQIENAKADNDYSKQDASVTRWAERGLALQAVVVSFADELASTNPRFNKELFVKACMKS